MKIKMLFIFLILYANLHTNQEPTKLFITTIPKSGSHLITKCVNLLTKKNINNLNKFLINDNIINFYPKSNYLASHMQYSMELENILKKQNFKCLFLYRDPRDLIISYIFWLIKDFNQLPAKQNSQNFLLDMHSFITVLINNIKKYYDCYLPWMQSNIFYSIKFEDLVGEKGFGSRNKQIEAINNICKHLSIKIDPKQCNKIANSLFGGTGTFREGKIGKWKKYFSNEHKEQFKQIAGQLLIDLDYEKDFNW